MEQNHITDTSQVLLSFEDFLTGVDASKLPYEVQDNFKFFVEKFLGTIIVKNIITFVEKGFMDLSDNSSIMVKVKDTLKDYKRFIDALCECPFYSMKIDVETDLNIIEEFLHLKFL